MICLEIGEGRGRKKHRCAKYQWAASHICSDQGLNPQPRHVLRLGIVLQPLGEGQRSNQLNHMARALLPMFQQPSCEEPRWVKHFALGIPLEGPPEPAGMGQNGYLEAFASPWRGAGATSLPHRARGAVRLRVNICCVHYSLAFTFFKGWPCQVTALLRHSASTQNISCLPQTGSWSFTLKPLASADSVRASSNL